MRATQSKEFSRIKSFIAAVLLFRDLQFIRLHDKQGEFVVFLDMRQVVQISTIGPPV